MGQLPNRVSLKQCKALIGAFLEERTGGVRLQAVAVALFRCIGQRFGLFSEVSSSNVNAADASTGSVADLECLDGQGKEVLAVEVKDRQLTLTHTQDKLPAVRTKGIRELLFLVQGGVAPQNGATVDDLVERQFVTGQNIYISEFDAFLESCLVLFGEAGRRSFLKLVGDGLEQARVDLIHRKKWSGLLESV